MNKKHIEYIQGKPQLGDRSRGFPGCSVYMDLAFFNKKSSDGKDRPGPRPRFLERHDHLWTNWIKEMRRNGLTDQDVHSAKVRNKYNISENLTREFENTCPVKRRKPNEPKCTSYFEFCFTTANKMSEFYLSELEGLKIPKSRDMFSDQVYDMKRDVITKPVNAGFIYMITTPHDNIVKIGKASENNLDSRFKEAQRHRVDAEIYYSAYVDNYSQVESQLHRDYSDFRCDGPQRELFSLSQSQLCKVRDRLRSMNHHNQPNQ